MVNSIPTFRLEVSEGMIDVVESADRLFGYCIEASKGPVLEPTFVASNSEAKRIFGVDFAPHFSQKPTGLVICRVGFEGMARASITYQAYNMKNIRTEENPEWVIDENSRSDILKITSTSEGVTSHKVYIAKSLTGAGYNLSVTIEGVTAKNYQNLRNLSSIVKKINTKFSNYLKAELLVPESEFNKYTSGEPFSREQFFTLGNHPVPLIKDPNVVDGSLTGGSNGKMLKTDGTISNIDIPADGLHSNPNYTLATVITNQPDESFVGQQFYIDNKALADDITIYPLYTEPGVEAGIYIKCRPISSPDATYAFTSYADPEGTTEWGEGTVYTIGTGPNDANPEVTLLNAYEKAFKKIQGVDLIGISTLSDSRVVQNTLIEHINEVNDPEVAQLRFGITGFLDYVVNPTKIEDQVSVEDLTQETEYINNEWIIYIGQGVIFEQEGIKQTLLPYQAVQLYTGLRSALGYAEAIFGGEPKKVLNGVVDTLPVITDGSIIVKSDIEALNEAGVCTFKREYKEITFVEGVTTVQDNDVLSYESMMSIVAHVTKRLITIARPYQGQLLTESLKATLTTALSAELRSITDSDGTLMALEDFNIPPYDVQVYSAAKTKFDESNHLIRESKIIIQCRIVPVGALRDIDLGVIVI